MTWEPQKRDGKDGTLCKTHDQWFEALDQCSGCEVAPIPAPSAESDWSPPPPPEGCHSSIARERWLTESATYCYGQGERLSGGVPGARGRPNYSAAVKWIEAALKFARAASGFTETRERREYIKHLRKHAEQLRARGAGR